MNSENQALRRNARFRLIVAKCGPGPIPQLPMLSPEDEREWIERIRWPRGIICPSCGGTDLTPLHGCSRPGAYKCRSCRSIFSAKMHTLMEKSKLPFRQWCIAIALVISGAPHAELADKLGVSLRQAAKIQRRIQQDVIDGYIKWHGQQLRIIGSKDSPPRYSGQHDGAYELPNPATTGTLFETVQRLISKGLDATGKSCTH